MQADSSRELYGWRWDTMGVEIKFHAHLTSAVRGVNWPASPSGRINQPTTYWIDSGLTPEPIY
jgi:hypothetical protein